MAVEDTLGGQQMTHYCNLAGTGAGPVLCPVVGPALGLWHVSSSQSALLPSAAWDAGCPGIGHSWARWKVKLPTPDPSCNFLPWMIKPPTPFPSQDQDLFSRAGQFTAHPELQAEHILKTVLHFWEEKVMNMSHSQIQKAASFWTGRWNVAVCSLLPVLCPESLRNAHCYHGHPYTRKEKGISWTIAHSAWDQGSYLKSCWTGP